VYGLQIRELVIVRVDARTEEEACVSPVDDLVLSELDEVGLVLLVAGGDEAVDLLLLSWGSEMPLARGLARWRERIGGGGRKGGLTSPFNFIFSSSLYGAYHFARRVLPLLDRFISNQDSNLSRRNSTRPSGMERGGNVLPVLDQDEREDHLQGGCAL
jgi:hypothetical protein